MDVGFIGLGNMGYPIAMRLKQAGYRLKVFDTRAEAMDPLVAAGATAALSVEEVGANTDFVFLCLPKPELVGKVGFAAATGGRAAVIIDLSSTGPIIEAELASRLKERGIALLDCPISGGPAKAHAGTLSVMVSGPRDAVDSARPLLDTLGNVFVVSDQPGLSQVLKLLNNMLSYTALVTSSEVLALGRKSGLAMDTMLEVINTSSGRNSATMEKFPNNIITGAFDFGGAVAISRKDTTLCLEHARATGIEMPISEAITEAVAHVVKKFGPDADVTSIARYAAERAGVSFNRD